MPVQARDGQADRDADDRGVRDSVRRTLRFDADRPAAGARVRVARPQAGAMARVGDPIPV